MNKTPSFKTLRFLSQNPDREYLTSELYHLADKPVSIGPTIRSLRENEFISVRAVIENERLVKYIKITRQGLQEVADGGKTTHRRKQLEVKLKYLKERSEYYSSRAMQIEEKLREGTYDE